MSKRNPAPPGTKWCSYGQHFEKIEEFAVTPNRGGRGRPGSQPSCHVCKRANAVLIRTGNSFQKNGTRETNATTAQYEGVEVHPSFLDIPTFGRYLRDLAAHMGIDTLRIKALGRRIRIHRIHGRYWPGEIAWLPTFVDVTKPEYIQQIEEVMRLRDLGWTYRQIAAKTGVPFRAVGQLVRMRKYEIRAQLFVNTMKEAA